MLGRTLIALCAASCLGLTQAPARPRRRDVTEPAHDLDELVNKQLIHAGLGSAPKTAYLDQAERRMKDVLACGTAAADAGCRVTIRYIAEGLRAFTQVQVFSMLVWAFD